MSREAIKPEFERITSLILTARQRAFAKVTRELVLLYYQVGILVAKKVAEGQWGAKTVDELAEFIQSNITGIKGFNRRGLYRMKQFYETYAPKSDCVLLWKEQRAKEKDSTLGTKEDISVNAEIMSSPLTQLTGDDDLLLEFVSAVLTQIGWSQHLMILSKTKSPGERLFYLHTVIREKLSVRELERHLNSAYFERTMLSDKRIENTGKHVPEGVFKDPCIFEFLDLPEIHSENHLESALIENLRKFILEIGKGFSYMGNQYRIQVGMKDYYTDLLFYHRDLQCLVMFELKIEEFKPGFLGKLNFYLEALDRDVKRENEYPSIGALLCKTKDAEVVEYALARNVSPAMIADYETRLIDKAILKRKLHELTNQLFKKNE